MERAFLLLDAVLHRYHALPWHPLRRRALAAAERWVVAHQEADGSWGGIQPPTVYSMMALHALGYALDHPVMRRALDGMHDRWMIRRADGGVRVQACLSPVWDTALSLVALQESDTDRGDAMVQATAPWLRDNLGFAATERQLRAMRRLDDPSCMKLLSDLARAAAERQVEEAHFPAGFTPA